MVAPAVRTYSSLVLLLAGLASAAVFLSVEKLADQGPTVLTLAYTEALAAGQSYLKIAPDPLLLALPNPYDPNENSGVRLLDASLFNRRYYLYFGLTPFVTVLVPWLAMTGQPLAEVRLITAYGIGAMVCLAFILWEVRRRYFPRAGPGTLAMALLAGSLSSAGLLLVRSPHIYELEIAAAWFHDSFALAACCLALHDRKRLLLWLALAGLSAGLAVGARPSHVGATAVTTIFICIQLRGLPGGRPVLLRRLAITLAPLAAVAVAVAWFNWIRFGSPLDFGYLYQLNNVNDFAGTFSHVRNIPYNLWQYWLGLPTWSGWFPFFSGPAVSPVPVPRNYYFVIQVYGALITAPFAICGLVLLTLGRGSSPALKALTRLSLCYGILNLAFLLVIFGATYRYTVDFLPYLLLLGCFGLLALGERAARRWHSRLAHGTGLALAFFSILSSVCATAALYDLTQLNNPAEFARIGRIFNQPRLWWERWHHTPLQQFRVETLLPQNRYGAIEPLLVTGSEGLQDFIYICYTAPGFLQVGYEAIGRGGPVSDLIPVDYGKPVVFELGLGQDWPPSGAHPYGPLTAAEVAVLRRGLIVKVNGQIALDCSVDGHLTKEFYHWGRSPHNDAFGSSFSGTKLAITKVPLGGMEQLASARASDYGPLQLALSEAAILPGTRVPLLSIGYRNRGQLLSVMRRPDGLVQFICTTSGAAELISSPVNFSAQDVHRLDFSSGGLLPPMESHLWKGFPAVDQRQARNRVQIIWDGSVILDGVAAGPEVSPASVNIGRNTVGISGVSPSFSGQLKVLGRETYAPVGR